MNPPIVCPVINPSNQRIMSMTKIVHNICSSIPHRLGQFEPAAIGQSVNHGCKLCLMAICLSGDESLC